MSSTGLKSAAADIAHGSEVEPSVEPKYLAVRLSALIFLAFTIMGAWLPVFSLHLKNLNFSADATAWASATNAIGAMIAPFIWGQIADRWLAVERCISLCAFVTAILLWCLALVEEPVAVFVVCAAAWLFLIPVVGLTGAFIFRHLEHPERQYGRIRVWGTVGWMAANWCLGGWLTLKTWLIDTPLDYTDSLRLGAVAAFAVALYAWTMPHTPPIIDLDSTARQRSGLGCMLDAPLTALRLFRNRSFIVYCLCMFGLYITLPFAIQLNPLLLKQLEVDARMLPIYLTVCQSTEVIGLILLPILLSRFGAKPTMLLGGLAWAAGLFLLAIGAPLWLVLAGFSTSGIFICCFVIAGQVFVNRQATHDIRASAQAILIFINGSGLLLGHLVVGWMRDLTNDRYDIAYLAAGVAAATLVLSFWIGFSRALPAPISGREALVPNSEIT